MHFGGNLNISIIFYIYISYVYSIYIIIIMQRLFRFIGYDFDKHIYVFLYIFNPLKWTFEINDNLIQNIYIYVLNT